MVDRAQVLLNGGTEEGDSSVVLGPYHTTRHYQIVRLFGSATLIGWYIPSKDKYGQETKSEQVPRGKDEKDFEMRVNECLKLLGGKRMGLAMYPD